MALGLGKTKQTETQDKLHKLAKHLIGQCGLLFTNKESDEVLEWVLMQDMYESILFNNKDYYVATGCNI